MGLAPGIYITTLLKKLRVNFLAMVKVITQGSMHLGKREVRVVADDFLRRPAAPKIIRRQHCNARAGVAGQPGGLPLECLDVRIISNQYAHPLRLPHSSQARNPALYPRGFYD